MSSRNVGSIQKKYQANRGKMILRVHNHWSAENKVGTTVMATKPWLTDSIGLQQFWSPPPAYAWQYGPPQTKEPSKTKIFIRTLGSFCSVTTLHGFKNVMDDLKIIKAGGIRQQKISTIISLLIWISACIAGVTFALVLMYLVWSRFDNNPTITTVETTNYPIWNVPFPAVTICNINKVFSPAIKNISKILEDHGVAEDKRMKFFASLDKLINPDYMDMIFFKAFDILEQANYTTERLMYELMEPCEYMITNCSWLGIPTPCETLFRVSKSSLGFCCSFNYIGIKSSYEFDTSNNYSNDEQDKIFHNQHQEQTVYRVSGAGSHIGLGALVRVGPNYYMSYTRSFYGVSILIHGPDDYPQASVTTVIGQPGCDLTISVTPSVITSSAEIRSIPQKRRNCLFSDEKKLRTTDKYSYQSCITECAVDTILKKCQCLPFYYPEANLHTLKRKIRQCALKDVKCLRDYQHIFYSLQPADQPIDEDGLNEIGMDCSSCLPGCSEENYSVQTNLARRHADDNLRSIHFDSINLSNYVTFKIHFKDISCIKYRRDVFQTWDGLLASFGGIFGLCLGGSVISLVEMAYFLTFRFYNDYLTEKNKGKISVNVQPLEKSKLRSKSKMKKNTEENSKEEKIHQFGNVHGNIFNDGVGKLPKI